MTPSQIHARNRQHQALVRLDETRHALQESQVQVPCTRIKNLIQQVQQCRDTLMNIMNDQPEDPL